MAGVPDQATDIVSGTFTAAAQNSTAHAFYGAFNLFASGVGTVVVQRSYDGGNTWLTHSIIISTGIQAMSFAITAAAPLSIMLTEPERGMMYQLNCSAYTSTITYRLSATAAHMRGAV